MISCMPVKNVLKEIFMMVKTIVIVMITMMMMLRINKVVLTNLKQTIMMY